jgi:hypothetical protein
VGAMLHWEKTDEPLGFTAFTAHLAKVNGLSPFCNQKYTDANQLAGLAAFLKTAHSIRS